MRFLLFICNMLKYFIFVNYKTNSFLKRSMLSNLPTFQGHLYQSSYGKQIKRKGLKRNEMYTQSQTMV